METTTYASRLRYLDARDVDDEVVDFDGLAVRGTNDENLGDIDGFLVDAASGRLLYVVVDSGGWFRSQRFLLPIGHAATIDPDRRAVRVDVSKERLRRYPEFEEDCFRQFSDGDLRAFEAATVAACCPGETDEEQERWPYETRRHYSQPYWWETGNYTRERLRPIELDAYRVPAPTQEHFDREHAVAREADDVSPHFEGRAQPGDVLGIETGGERSYMGDTAEEENERRRVAERTGPDVDDEPGRSER